MIRRLIAFAGCALALAAFDLAAKALWPPPPPELFHDRSTAWFLASFILLTCCFVLAFLSSAIVCAAAATCAGGLIGNLVSALTHGGRIPDPFLLGGAAHGIAFNPADVFFILGVSGLVCASIQRVVCATGSRQKPDAPRASDLRDLSPRRKSLGAMRLRATWCVFGRHLVSPRNDEAQGAGGRR